VAQLLNMFFLALNGALAVPTVVYGTEIASGILVKRKPNRAIAVRRPSVAIVVPAHNEEDNIGGTIAALLPQLAEGDRVVVVADNCEDRTAAIARAAGVEVVERYDTQKRGKGYALDAGVAYVAKNPAECLIILDADCRLSDGAIDMLARQVAETDKPAQAVYLMTAPKGAPIETQVAAFAYVIKCLARPLGLRRLGLPNQLMGTGMAFPWKAIETVDLANGHLTEDLKLGLDLAVEGYAPFLCEDAYVTSEFPCTEQGIRSQRSRWENGHLSMLGNAIAGFFKPGILRQPGALVLSLDMMVPPLTLLLLLLIMMFGVTALFAMITGSVGAFLLAAFNLAFVVGASLIGWAKYGRSILPARAFGHIATYALGKIPLYVNKLILRRNSAGWVRTDRNRAESTTEARP